MLNKITELLNLNYYCDNDGKTYIINPEDENLTQLVKDNGVNYFAITINNKKVYCAYNDTTNSLCILSKNKYLYIDDAGFTYLTKDNDSKESISLTKEKEKTTLSITDERNNISKTINVDIKDESYNKFTSRVVVKEEHGFSVGETEITGIDKAVAKNKFKKFNENNQMIRGNIYEDELYLPTEVFIEQELDNNRTLQNLLSEIEENIPGLIKQFPTIIELYKNKEKHFK